MKDKTLWWCVDTECSTPLGEVIGRELRLSEDVRDVQTRGPNLVVTCPNCGQQKVWYTADPVVRAVTQFVDAITSAMAGRIVSIIDRQTIEYVKDR